MQRDNIQILMIDDEEDDFLITKHILEKVEGGKFFIEWVSAFEDAIAAFQQKTHDVYLVDYGLRGHNGLELVAEAQKMGVEAPLILLTGQDNADIDELALRAGAADYLVKGTLTPYHIDRAIRYSIQQAKQKKEIASLNIFLEQRVAERTIALETTLDELNRSREELTVALKKEKELNDLKSRFVSMTSHEFRTPLATILSSLYLLKKYVAEDRRENEKIDKHIVRIGSAANNMTELLNDVLSLGKLDEGAVPSQQEKICLRDFISEIVQEMRDVLKPGQQIQYHYNGDGQLVSLDKNVLKNILLNLISNAIKFSPEGKNIRVVTTLWPHSAMIEVCDEGIGISEEDQKYLFQRFFRGKNAVNIQGTGLGLNIVVKYIELLHGTISFVSEPGKGSTFTIEFPQNNLIIK